MSTVRRPPQKSPPQQTPPPPAPLGGVVHDLQRVKTDSTAVIAELREFLAQTRGKTPQELLGLVAQSGLVRCTMFSTVLVVGFLAVFTVVPYLLRDKSKPATKPTVAEQTEPVPATPAVPATAANRPATTDGSPTGDPALDALGIGETKNADPKKNPLEDSLDNLLDKIE